jgi:uncharacterized delta-60 repeat protein
MPLKSLRWTLFLAAVLLFVPLAAGSGQLKPGSLDPSFGRGGFVKTVMASSWATIGTSSPGEFALQPDGKIVAAGFVPKLGSQDDFTLVRQKQNGTPDPSFGTNSSVSTFVGSSVRAYAVVVQQDGKIVALGASPTGGNDLTLVRYLPTGSLDQSFGSGGIVMTDVAALTGYTVGSQGVSRVLVQADGKIVAGFEAANYNGDGFGLVRYDSKGSLDPSFGGGGAVVTLFPPYCGADGERDLALQPDGKIVALGWVASTGGECIGGPSIVQATLVRYNADGSLDASFGTGGIAQGAYGSTDQSGPMALALQPDGKIVTAGAAEGNHSEFVLDRHNADGSLDRSFAPKGYVLTPFAGDSTAAAVAVQSDGKIVAAGSTGAGGGEKVVLARYRTSGSPDRGFGTDGVTRTSIRGGIGATSIALQSRKIIVGGSLSTGHTFVLLRYLGGASHCVVPDVEGRTLRHAKRAIRRSDCVLGHVTRRFSRAIPVRRVIAQRPRAHTRHPAGTKVNLVVSKGKR